jgi:hypothetical protein
MFKVQINEMAILYAAVCVVYFWEYSDHPELVAPALLAILYMNMFIVMLRKPH